ncbi:MAG: pyrroloquinoline quinone precursor peptide PqqA [Polyangiales bacterium]
MDNWERPTFIEVDLSAEIGGYQGEDPGEGHPNGPDHLPDFISQQAESTT